MPDEPPLLLAPLRAELNRLASGGLGSERGRQALVAHAARLRREAGHLPQAVRLADAVDRCASLPIAEAAPQLLKLLVAMQQLDAAPAASPPSSPDLDRRPLPPAPEHLSSTPLAPELLLELRAAFAKHVQPPTTLLQLLSRPEVVEDVRTWPLLEEGLAHPQLREASADALIRLGPTLAPHLRRRFNRRGDATDAARLEVLAAVERSDLTPLLLEAARRGSAPVRRVALEALTSRVDLTGDAREAVILEVYDAAPASERPDLARALARLGTDPALRRLWVLASEGTLSELRLRKLLAPERVQRWLALVDEAVPGFSESAAFFQLLEGWDAPGVGALLAERTLDPDPRLRRLAAEARLASPGEAALQALAEHCLADSELLDVAVTALHRLDGGLAHPALGSRVEAWLGRTGTAKVPPPLPHWLRLLHQLGDSADGVQASWWPRLDALVRAGAAHRRGDSGPLQPAAIRERKEP